MGSAGYVHGGRVTGDDMSATCSHRPAVSGWSACKQGRPTYSTRTEEYRGETTDRGWAGECVGGTSPRDLHAVYMVQEGQTTSQIEVIPQWTLPGGLFNRLMCSQRELFPELRILIEEGNSSDIESHIRCNP